MQRRSAKFVSKLLTEQHREIRKEIVSNKEICIIRVVFILCKALRYLFARLLTEGKTLFFSQADCCVRHLLRQNRYDDIVKFQIGLVILPSSKNFDKRLA